MPDADAVARFDAALTRLAPGDGRIGLAVSGGPDSIALLLLAAAARPGRVAAATVDHGLRAEAAGEAAFVAALCAGRDVPHATLRIRVAPAGTGLQAAARTARYAALADWCGAQGIGTLATAHHADDQAETLLMRLARGAGLAGLAAIRDGRPLHDDRAVGGPRLVRPLLGHRKAGLVALVRAAGIVPVDDPSNRDPRHDRTAARALFAATPWLDPARLAASAAHLAEAAAALDWAADRAWAERAVRSGDALTFDPAGLPDELVRRLLVRALAGFGGPAPDGPEIARLKAALDAGRTATLAGVLAHGGAIWRFSAEPPRRRGPSPALHCH